ncbi:hypothetical protein ES708_01440 [subsurface metagenome]
MSKPIKLEDKVYYQLAQLRGKRETFSDVVAKLLTAKEAADTLSGICHGQGAESEFKPASQKG